MNRTLVGLARNLARTARATDIMIAVHLLWAINLFAWPDPHCFTAKNDQGHLRVYVSFTDTSRSRWMRGLRRGFVAVRLVGSLLRIPTGAWMSVFWWMLCEVSATNWSLILRSLTDCGFIVCDLETSMRQSRRVRSRQKRHLYTIHYYPLQFVIKMLIEQKFDFIMFIQEKYTMNAKGKEDNCS
jgi:hypothetical protein